MTERQLKRRQQMFDKGFPMETVCAGLSREDCILVVDSLEKQYRMDKQIMESLFAEIRDELKEPE